MNLEKANSRVNLKTQRQTFDRKVAEQRTVREKFQINQRTSEVVFVTQSNATFSSNSLDNTRRS